MEVFTPVTIIETPPLTVMGIRAYERTSRGLKTLTDVLADDLKEDLERRINLPKNYDKDKALDKIEENKDYIEEVRVLVHTNPRLVTGVPKKKPEIFECGLGGKDPQEKLEYALELLGKDVKISEIFSEGEYVDTIAVTKGKGFQGPVKRWGIKIQNAKTARSGKGRHIGSLGPWTPSRTMWRVPQAGQTGYHRRTEYNKMIMKIGTSDEVEKINPKGGFIRYGLVRNDYLLVKGSVPGPTKRLIMLRKAIRPKVRQEKPPEITYIHKAS